MPSCRKPCWVVLFVIAFFLGLMVGVGFVGAQENIIISEYMPDPSDGNEWVELYNPNQDGVTLNSWYIDDIANGGGGPKVFSLVLGPQSYQVVDLNSDSFLNNSGDDVRLLDASQAEKDKTTYNASQEGKSWSKTNSQWCMVDATPNAPNNPCVLPTDPPTPTNTITSTPVPSPTTAEIDYNLYLNEVMPDPDGDDEADKPNGEWVEIYNPDKINLGGFIIKDQADHSISISDSNSEQYADGTYWVVYRNGDAFSLNNTGDSVRLLHEYQLVDDMLYDTSTAGKSWSSISGNWCQSAPTKGGANGSCWVEEDDDDSSDPTANPTATKTPTPSPVKTVTPTKTPTPPKPSDRILGASQSAEATASSGSAFFDLFRPDDSPASPAAGKKAIITYLPWILIGTGTALSGASGGMYWWKRKKIKSNS